MNIQGETQELSDNDLKKLGLSFQVCTDHKHIENSLSEMTDKEKIKLLFKVKELKQPKENHTFGNKIIHLIILENLFKAENGLLDMVIRKLYSKAILSSATIDKSNITVYPKHGMAVNIDLLSDNRFTPELLAEAYNKLGNKSSAKVAEVINEFSNSVLQIQKLREIINTSGLLKGDDILEVLKNKEIKSLLLQYKVQARGLLKDLETLHDISCEEEKIKPSEHISLFNKRSEDS